MARSAGCIPALDGVAGSKNGPRARGDITTVPVADAADWPTASNVGDALPCVTVHGGQDNAIAGDGDKSAIAKGNSEEAA